MKINFKEKCTNWLATRYQVVIRHEKDFAERSSFRFSYASLVITGFFLFFLLTGLGLLFSNVLFRKWLNPNYIAQRGEEQVDRLYRSINELEEKNNEQLKFIQNFQQALGATIDDTTQQLDEAAMETIDSEAVLPLTKDMTEEIMEESNEMITPLSTFAPDEIKTRETSLVNTAYGTASRNLSYLTLIPPLEGRITTSFNVALGHYGLDLVGKEKAPIQAVTDGKVMLATWTVEMGWLIIVQHDHGLVSIYKHNAVLFKQEGHPVRKGEVIALMGNSGEFSTGPHLHFELWHDGEPINPEDFIVF